MGKAEWKAHFLDSKKFAQRWMRKSFFLVMTQPISIPITFALQLLVAFMLLMTFNPQT